MMSVAATITGVEWLHIVVQVDTHTHTHTPAGVKKSLSTWAKGKGLEYCRNLQAGHLSRLSQASMSDLQGWWLWLEAVSAHLGSTKPSFSVAQTCVASNVQNKDKLVLSKARDALGLDKCKSFVAGPQISALIVRVSAFLLGAALASHARCCSHLPGDFGILWPARHDDPKCLSFALGSCHRIVQCVHLV